MDKFKRILEGIYSWLFVLLILGCLIYFVFLPELGIDANKISFENFDIFGIKEAAYQDGFMDGRKEGVKAGKEIGYESGYEDGYEAGFNAGKIEKGNELVREGKTYDAGFREGYKAGKEEINDNGNIYTSGTDSSSGSGGNNRGFTNIYNSDTATESDYSSNISGSDSSGNGGGPGGFTDYGDAEVLCDYVLNKNTMKFHEPWCASVSNVKPNNREYFSGLRSDVISRGFEPCARCNP